MKCESCGHDNPDHIMFCGMCGRELQNSGNSIDSVQAREDQATDGQTVPDGTDSQDRTGWYSLDIPKSPKDQMPSGLTIVAILVIVVILVGGILALQRVNRGLSGRVFRACRRAKPRLGCSRASTTHGWIVPC